MSTGFFKIKPDFVSGRCLSFSGVGFRLLWFPRNGPARSKSPSKTPQQVPGQICIPFLDASAFLSDFFDNHSDTCSRDHAEYKPETHGYACFSLRMSTTQPIAIPSIIPKHIHAITRLSFFFIDFPFPLYLIPCLRSGYISAYPAAVRSAGDTPLLPVLILPIIPAGSQEWKDHACPCPLIHSRNGIIFVQSYPPNFSVPASALSLIHI